MNSNKIHLVCSSGGVKCFSYLGAINVLKKTNIEIASISACSMGTVVGSLIASGVDLIELERKILNFDFKLLRTKKWFSIASILMRPYATHTTPNYEQIMTYFLGEDMTLSQFKIPFSALALDIRQKRFLVYSSLTHPEMKISEVIKIATSVPFMYEPYKLDKRLLIDAAVATESPVWMAVNQSGNYPIVVLKVSKDLDSHYNKNFAMYLANLIGVAAESHDYFAASQITRNIDININCERMEYANFNITKEQIENLILQGEAATEQQLKEFNYNFNHILNFINESNIEEITVSGPHNEILDDPTSNAVNLANDMITNFKNEILNRDQIFVSYSHLDKKWLEKLNTSLSAIERFMGIKAWSDTLILPGEVWNKELTKALSSTKVAVLLVTPNFLASQFSQDIEMEYFLKIKDSRKVHIVWIAVSGSLYDFTPLKDLQCANNPRVPLDTLSDADQNIEITKICKKIIAQMKIV